MNRLYTTQVFTSSTWVTELGDIGDIGQSQCHTTLCLPSAIVFT